MEGLQLRMKRKDMTFPGNKLRNYLSKSDMLMLLEFGMQRERGELQQEAYGVCEECEGLSESLKLVDNKWVCRTCIEEIEVV